MTSKLRQMLWGVNRPMGEAGQGLAEYAIALAVITLAVIAAVQLLSGNVTGLWNNSATILQNGAG